MEDVWSTPNVVTTMRCGHVQDHALMMASMFMAVQCEDYDEVLERFEASQLKKNEKRARKWEKIMKKTGIETGVTSESD